MTKHNVLLITADDMNCDAVGAFDCPIAGTTPNLDQLAAEGMCFDRAHVAIAVCQPSRSTMMTGCYSHCIGGEGFYHLRQPDIPILPALLRDAGYDVGILGKVGHSTPYADFKWDTCLDINELGHGRNPAIYAQNSQSFIEHATQQDRPFFLMLNSHDPHRPFFGNDPADWYQDDCPAVKPSRVFSPEESFVPGFLPDLPDVRLEISEYLSSVRRCDDTVGAVLDVLRESGQMDNTLILYLSDNGMAFPFAKTNCYLHSTRTPLIVRYPNQPNPGKRDTDHFVSGIDLMPTILDAASVAIPEHVNGRSFLPIIKGETQEGRDKIFTQFHQTAGRRNYPMRCVQNKRFGYIFNAWSDGKTQFKNESMSGRTFNAMAYAAQNDPAIKERVELFVYRLPEELYDFENDVNALNNLIDDPQYQDVLFDLRSQLRDWMVATNDPVLAFFDCPNDERNRGKLLNTLPV
jgi:N-sulfoglucosamine sulfohydrolase